jgi:hypothetical protein
MMRLSRSYNRMDRLASRSEYLLDPDTPLRNPMTINYPGKDDLPSVSCSWVFWNERNDSQRFSASVLTVASITGHFADVDVMALMHAQRLSPL